MLSFYCILHGLRYTVPPEKNGIYHIWPFVLGIICNSIWQYIPYWVGTLPHSTGNFRSTSATDSKKKSLKYIKLNAYLALNGESETAFFASIKLSYSFALEEEILIIYWLSSKAYCMEYQQDNSSLCNFSVS